MNRQNWPPGTIMTPTGENLETWIRRRHDVRLWAFHNNGRNVFRWTGGEIWSSSYLAERPSMWKWLPYIHASQGGYALEHLTVKLPPVLIVKTLGHAHDGRCWLEFGQGLRTQRLFIREQDTLLIKERAGNVHTFTTFSNSTLTHYLRTI